MFMTVRLEIAESHSETSGEPARRQARRSGEFAIAAGSAHEECRLGPRYFQTHLLESKPTDAIDDGDKPF